MKAELLNQRTNLKVLLCSLIGVVYPQVKEIIRLSRSSSCFDGVYDSLGSNHTISSRKGALLPIVATSGLGKFKATEGKNAHTLVTTKTSRDAKANGKVLNNFKPKQVEAAQYQTEKRHERVPSNVKIKKSKKVSVDKESLKTHAPRFEEEKGTPNFVMSKRTCF